MFDLTNYQLIITLNLKEEYYMVRQTISNYLDQNLPRA